MARGIVKIPAAIAILVALAAACGSPSAPIPVVEELTPTPTPTPAPTGTPIVDPDYRISGLVTGLNGAPIGGANVTVKHGRALPDLNESTLGFPTSRTIRHGSTTYACVHPKGSNWGATDGAC